MENRIPQKNRYKPVVKVDVIRSIFIGIFEMVQLDTLFYDRSYRDTVCDYWNFAGKCTFKQKNVRLNQKNLHAQLS